MLVPLGWAALMLRLGTTVPRTEQPQERRAQCLPSIVSLPIPAGMPTPSSPSLSAGPNSPTSRATVKISAPPNFSHPLDRQQICLQQQSPGMPERPQKMPPCLSSPLAEGDSGPAGVLGKETTLQELKLQVWKDRAELGFVSDISISGPSPTQQNIYSFSKQSRITRSMLPTDVPQGCQDRWI